jgi:hypothetical protein
LPVGRPPGQSAAAERELGVSDLRDPIGLNRALNERMSDQADLIRCHADPPVMFRGVSEHTIGGV